MFKPSPEAMKKQEDGEGVGEVTGAMKKMTVEVSTISVVVEASGLHLKYMKSTRVQMRTKFCHHALICKFEK